jgi:NAD(P)-dependent dehydrogenase (short-subunit alcohol dehydrogenase family)
MGDRLKGKNAVVTGGGAGIGRAVSIAMAAEGANLLIVDYGVSLKGEGADATSGEKVAAEIKAKGGNAVAHFGNVADFKEGENIVNHCIRDFGRIDILVNGAGILRERMVWNMTEEEWDAVIAVHLKGNFNLCRHASGFMRQQKYGRIINITAEAWRGSTGQINYCAAKGGIVSLTRALARELGRYGVTANAIAPLAGTRMTVRPEIIAAAKKNLAAGLISQEFYDWNLNMPAPEYSAPLFVYLVSDKAADINGRVFHITKGKVAIYQEPVEQFAMYKSDFEGLWTIDDLEKCLPASLLVGYTNPAPPEKD